MGKGYFKMVESVSCLYMSLDQCVLTSIPVMFLVPSAAQATMSKIENHQLQIFCEQRGQLEKANRRFNRREKGRQVFRCVYSLTLE
jgi:hypothetical protein